MTTEDTEDEDSYLVVVNDEGQYSIWRDETPIPPGWHAEGRAGSRRDCLDYIDEVWVDMTPNSVRRRHASARPGSDDGIR